MGRLNKLFHFEPGEIDLILETEIERHRLANIEAWAGNLNKWRRQQKEARNKKWAAEAKPWRQEKWLRATKGPVSMRVQLLATMQPGQWYGLAELRQLVPGLNSGTVSVAARRGFLIKSRFAKPPGPTHIYTLGDPNPPRKWSGSRRGTRHKDFKGSRHGRRKRRLQARRQSTDVSDWCGRSSFLTLMQRKYARPP